MQSNLNLHANYGLPICVSGLTHRLTLSNQMADHERRREAMKKHNRSQAREGLHANQEVGVQRSYEIYLEEIKEGEVDGDLADLSFTCLACIAKAA